MTGQNHTPQARTNTQNPLEEREITCYDYKEDHIIQKLLYHHELRTQIMKGGYTHEQAEKMIIESVLRGIIDLTSIDPDSPKQNDKDRYVMANEKYWVEEYDRLGYFVVGDIIRKKRTPYTCPRLLQSSSDSTLCDFVV